MVARLSEALARDWMLDEQARARSAVPLDGSTLTVTDLAQLWLATGARRALSRSHVPRSGQHEGREPPGVFSAAAAEEAGFKKGEIVGRAVASLPHPADPLNTSKAGAGQQRQREGARLGDYLGDDPQGSPPNEPVAGGASFQRTVPARFMASY